MDANLPYLALVFAVVVLGDAIACAIPIATIKNDLDRLHVSASIQQVLAPVKGAAAVGIFVGLWIPVLGLLAAVGLVAYFCLAVATHVRFGDPLTRSIPALGFLVASAAVAGLCFASAL